MSFINTIKARIVTLRRRIPARRITRYVRHNPFKAFFITLGILLALIILSNVIASLGQKPPVAQNQVKAVQVYKIGTSPKVTLQARIEKSGVIKVVAQTNAIVQSIFATEGQPVSRGKQLLSLSSNYQGGSAPDLQALIAQKQNDITQSTFQDQKDLINKQRDLANNQQSNNDQLRTLTAQSATESADLINRNQDILNTISDQLTTYQNNQAQNVTPPSGSTWDQLILQTKELQSQYQGTINQLRTQQRQLAYQADGNQPFTQLQQNQKAIAIKQLDIQEKTLDINKEIGGLQLQLAYVNAAMMHPSSPCDGVIDRIFVNYGDSVNPGTAMVSVSCNNQSVKAIVMVPANLASTVSRVESSTIHLGGQTITETPDYVSRDATDGQLYSVIYHIPENSERYITDGNFVSADVPIGLPNTGAADPYIPLDAIYQTQSQAYLYKIVKGKAQNQSIDLGDVYGRYASVTGGINNGDQIILNRDIVDGEKVTVTH